MHWLLPHNFEGSPAVYVLVATVAFLMTAVTKGGFGGVGILSVPLMMTVAPARLVLGMWLPLLILCDICTIRAYPRQWSPRLMLLLAPWMLAGILIGWYLLGRVSAQWVKLCVGSLAIFFVLMEFVRLRILRRSSEDRPGWRPSWYAAVPFGVAGGISTMIAHAAGAITAVYLLPQRLDKRTFVGTDARFYFVVNTIKVPFLIHLGFINHESLMKSLWMAPLAPLGVWIGSWLNRRIASVHFSRVIYVLLAITGGYLLYDNL